MKRILHAAPALLTSLVLAACGGGTGPEAPLVPPTLTVTARDAAVTGEMTWLTVARAASDTGAITYTSSDTTVATVDASGRVLPRRPGSATLTATIGATSGTLTVSPVTRPDSFRIVFRWRWTPSAAERAVFEQAAARWHRVLRQSAPWTVSLPGGACLPGTTAQSITQQGAVILVDRFADSTVAPGVTGTAGPCLVDSLGRTQVGVITIRQSVSDSVGTMSAAARFGVENLLAHQVGQALGLAGLTVFGVPRPELDTTRSGDPRWTGALARAAYVAAGGTLDGVPLSTDLAFWRANDAGTSGDIMLPDVTSALRIGAVSVAGLGDRGYGIDATRLEPAAAPAAFVAPLAVVSRRTAPWRSQLWVSAPTGTRQLR